MKRFKLEDYKGNYVMHCETAEEAEVFCKFLHNQWKEWRGGDSYLDCTEWSDYKENTCYNFNSNTYYVKVFYEKDGYTILKFTDFDWSKEGEVDKVAEVFKLLGVEERERFAVVDRDGIFFINKNLEVCCVEQYTTLTIIPLLNGTAEIIKLPPKTTLTAEQIEILKASLVLEFEWIARDKNGGLYIYILKPTKGFSGWCSGDHTAYIKTDFPFIKWEDEEPTRISELLK